MIFEEGYKELKPEDRAFIDGVNHAIKYMESEPYTLDNFTNQVPEGSTLYQVIDELIKIVKLNISESIEAECRHLITGTLNSYEGDTID